MTSEKNLDLRKKSAREENKRIKLTNIHDAARSVFLSRGFDGATVRKIASEAGVGLGTLFLYARTKQDLLFLVFEQDAVILKSNAVHAIKKSDSCLDQLMKFLSVFYRYFGSTPQLSRDLIRESTFAHGIVARRLAQNIADIEFELARIVTRAQASGGLNACIEPDVAARAIFGIHQVEIRRCLNRDFPDIEGSLASLRKQIAMLLAGLEQPQD